MYDNADKGSYRFGPYCQVNSEKGKSTCCLVQIWLEKSETLSPQDRWQFKN